MLVMFSIIFEGEYMIMSEISDLTHYKKSRGLILNKKTDYHKNNKERLREQARDKYKSLSEEEKIKKENMGRIDITICPKKRD